MLPKHFSKDAPVAYKSHVGKIALRLGRPTCQTYILQVASAAFVQGRKYCLRAPGRQDCTGFDVKGEGMRGSLCPEGSPKGCGTGL